jgi:sugar transferase (PEP-CTERM/EpsH1 system associated)
MKILWVNTHFLHPPTRGGQIRTLEMLRTLHRRHEIHYVGLLEDSSNTEAVPRSAEYCTRAYPIAHHLPPRMSISFSGQAIANLFASIPLAVARYRSPEALRTVADMLQREHFDRVVCDFLFSAPNIPVLEQAVLFQHNVETTIWRRHVAQATDPFRRVFLRQQADRMEAYEGNVCRRVSHVVAVSADDSDRLRRMFDISHVSDIPTGVDTGYFRPPEPKPSASASTDLVFVGSMDWLPNIDGASWFVDEILPLIRRRRPQCSLVIVGRRPPRRIEDLARQDPRIKVTGTVDDIRPYLWSSLAAVVPLRIGGGTRLKIFEAMAARIPVISTSVGAEGLPVSPGEDILIADSPQAFADRCLEILDSPGLRSRVVETAWEMISSRFSWEEVTSCFERILEQAPGLK